MKQYVGKKIKVIGVKHPHRGEEVTVIKHEELTSQIPEGLICETSHGQNFYIFDESDIEIIK